MGLIPSTGSAIAMGRVYKAYTNVAVNTAGNATGSSPHTGSQNIRLSAILGAGATFGAQAAPAGTQISLSATFGGETTPYDY